ncbi:MAG: hypothetical protein QF767_17270, partial [Alphaproteobacteria bacterium]|nr:hypothetical protein [Alphaproteobacteria bacterium]
MTDATERRQIPLRGILYMLATAVVIFPLLNASVKFLAEDYSLVQIIWIRSVVHLLWMLVLFMPGMGLRLFAARRLKLQLTRSLLQLIALVCFIVGLLYIPMTTATATWMSQTVLRWMRPSTPAPPSSATASTATAISTWWMASPTPTATLSPTASTATTTATCSLMWSTAVRWMRRSIPT